MKVKFIVVLLFSILCSCSDSENVFINNEQAPASFITARTAGDKKYDVLGFGYDITEPFAGDKSVRNYPIIDVNTLLISEKNNPRVYFDNPFQGVIYSRIFSGEDAQKYVQEISTKTKFSSSVASNGFPLNVAKGLFSASVKYVHEHQSKHTYSTSYSYASVDVIKKQRRLFLTADISVLSKYLSPIFSSYLEAMNTPADAYRIVELFGTHTLLDISIGGYYRSYFKSLILEDNKLVRKKDIVESGAKVTLTKIGLGADFGWEREKKTENYKKNVSWNTTIYSHGGERNGLNISTNTAQGTSFTTSLDSWSASVQDNTSRLIDLDWNSTYPLYDLVSDSNKKELLKEAIIKYIKDRELEVVETTPLNRYWNGKFNMFYPTTIYGESRMTSDWKYEGVIGICLSKPQSNTHALHRYWNSKYNMFYLTNTYGECKMTSDWKYEGIIGYVYKTKQEGTIPLHRYWNSRFLMFYFTSTLGETRMTDDWAYDGVIGYIYPSDLPCVDRDKYPDITPFEGAMTTR